MDSLEQLKQRVKAGNQKLNDAWKAVCQIDHTSQMWSDELERWHQANEKLSLLCLQLEALGYVDCLYIIEEAEIASMVPEEKDKILKRIDKGIYQKLNGKVKTQHCLAEGIGCRVCPSQIRYWETELMELPSAKT